MIAGQPRSRLVALVLCLFCLGRQDAVAADDLVLHFFAAEDTACVRRPLHSYAVAENGHFLDAPEVATDDGSDALVHFRCTGSSLIASLSPGVDLCSWPSFQLPELAEGHCMPAAATAMTASLASLASCGEANTMASKHSCYVL